MFNVDRWAIYTAQKMGFHPKYINFYQGNWAVTTPKQTRRMKKKFRRGDTSIGMHV